MLLSENRVWDVVSGKFPRPEDPAVLPEAEQSVMTVTAHRAAEKAVAE